MDRLNKAYFAYSPTVAQSAPARTSNDVFAGVATINSGTATSVILGVDIRSESVIYLGAPIFSTAANSGANRAFAVTSLTVNTSANSGAAGFQISTLDGLGSGTGVRVPWTIWRIGQVNPV
jgi:hypothetical protein